MSQLQEDTESEVLSSSASKLLEPWTNKEGSCQMGGGGPQTQAEWQPSIYKSQNLALHSGPRGKPSLGSHRGDQGESTLFSNPYKGTFWVFHQLEAGSGPGSRAASSYSCT